MQRRYEEAGERGYSDLREVRQEGAEEPEKHTRRPSSTSMRNVLAEDTERIFSDAAAHMPFLTAHSPPRHSSEMLDSHAVLCRRNQTRPPKAHNLQAVQCLSKQSSTHSEE